jgi:CDGSH iron-sulfur domain-containing protein 3
MVVLKSPKKNHYKIKVKKGKIYHWCTCDLSMKQPFCDNSHKKYRKFVSLKYLADETQEVFFCGCKKTKHQPFCDGSHSKP